MDDIVLDEKPVEAKPIEIVPLNITEKKPEEPPKRPRGRPRAVPGAPTTQSIPAPKKESKSELQKKRDELKRLYRNPDVLKAYKKVEVDVSRIPDSEVEDRLQQAKEAERELISKKFDTKVVQEMITFFHNKLVRRIVDVDIAKDLEEDSLLVDSIRENLWIFSYLPSPVKVGLLYVFHILVGLKNKIIGEPVKTDGTTNANTPPTETGATVGKPQ